MAGTVSYADMYGFGTSSGAAPAIMGIDGAQPGAVAPASGMPAYPTAAPAYAWAAFIGLLALLRWAYDRGR